MIFLSVISGLPNVVWVSTVSFAPLNVICKWTPSSCSAHFSLQRSTSLRFSRWSQLWARQLTHSLLQWLLRIFRLQNCARVSCFPAYKGLDRYRSDAPTFPSRLLFHGWWLWRLTYPTCSPDWPQWSLHFSNRSQSLAVCCQLNSVNHLHCKVNLKHLIWQATTREWTSTVITDPSTPWLHS